MSTQKNSTKRNSSAKKAREKYICGIDIGSDELRAAIVCNNVLKDTFQVISDGVTYGAISDQVAFENALGRLLSDISKIYSPFPSTIVVTTGSINLNSITSTSSTITSRADGVVGELDVKKSIDAAKEKITDLRNKTILHSITIKSALDGKEVIGDPVGAVGSKMDSKILFIYDDIKQEQAIVSAFKKYSLDIDEIVAGPLADSIVTLTPRERRIGVASVNVGYSTTGICVYENNSPLLVSVFKSGGEHITSDIALGTRVELELAEKLKCNDPSVDMPRRRVDEIIEARLSDIALKINNELNRIKRAELLPAGIVLSGGTSLLAKIEYYMRYDLKLPIINALKNIRPNNNFYIDDPRFVRCFGATYFGNSITEKSIYMNFFKYLASNLSHFMKKFLP